MLEKDIEDRVVTWAQRNKFLTPKVKFVEAGYPDRMFVSPYGHTIFIEFKKPGEVPTPIQYHRIEQLTKRGVPATWSDNYVHAVNVLKYALETAVGSPSIPEEGDTPTLAASVRGAFPGSRIGEDFDSLGNLQNLEREGLNEEDVDHCPTPSSFEGVAGRDKEVE